MEYREQLAWKRQSVVDAFSPFPMLSSVSIPLPQPAPRRLGYRIQTKLAVVVEKGEPALGIYRRGSHVVQDISRCILHHPLIGNAIPVIRDAMAKARVPIHDSRRGRAGVRYLLIRASELEKKILLTLVSSCTPLPRVAKLLSYVRARLPVAGVHLNVNRSTGNVILGGQNFRVWGRSSLSESYGRLILAAPPTAFVQANTGQAARIYKTIATAARSSNVTRAVDLYCGVGGLALSLALNRVAVTGVEELRDAVKFASANARANHLTRARFLTAKVEESLREKILGGADLITANPPRKGLGAGVAARVAASAVENIYYLSCWAPSFAKDTHTLCRLGFELVELRLFDMLPHTEHVEILGRFHRRKPRA